MKKISIYNYVAGTMLILSILIMGCGVAAQAQEVPAPSKLANIWIGSGAPNWTVMSNNTVYHDTTNYLTYYRIKGTQYGPYSTKGDRGDVGAQGPQGVQGIPGEPGSGGAGGFVKSFGTMRYVGTEQELRTALAGWTNGSVNSITLYQDIPVYASIEMAHKAGNRSKRLIINLNGNAIYDASASGLAFLLGRHPASQTEALNDMVSSAIIIRDGALIGKTGTGILYEPGPTYGAIVEGVEFMNAAEAIHCRFGLMTMIQSCLATNVSESFIFDDGTGPNGWPNASSSNSQSNSSMRECVRDFGRAGGHSSFSDYAASGIININTISEGGAKKYGWYVDSRGSTVVKDGRMISSHLEMQPTIAGIELKLSEGYYIVDGLYSQYPATLVSASAIRGYPHVYVKNVPWHLGNGQHKYKTGSNSVIWAFDDLHPTVDPSLAAAWVDGTMPYYWSVKGFNQSPFHKFNSFTATASGSITMNTLVANNLTTTATANLNGTVKINGTIK